MDDRGDAFFKWVWRINGLLLLALAVAALVSLLSLLVNLGIAGVRDRPDEQLTHVAGTDLAHEALNLGDFHAIAGTRLLCADLTSSSRYVASGSSGGFRSIHNLLFFDSATKKAHWLLPGNEKTITSVEFLMDPPGESWSSRNGEAEEEGQRAIAILLELQEPGDDTVGRAIPRSIVMASPQGRDLRTVAQGTEGILGHHQPSADSLLVFYVAGGTARVMELDPVAREVVSDEALAVDR